MGLYFVEKNLLTILYVQTVRLNMKKPVVTRTKKVGCGYEKL